MVSKILKLEEAKRKERIKKKSDKLIAHYNKQIKKEEL